MTAILYNNQSEQIAVTKNIQELTTLSGTLRDECSISDPVILFDGISEQITAGANYAFIQEFNRYYYITDITFVRNKLFRVSMHVDVLMSFSAQIREQTGVIARQENQWNLNLNDGVFKTYQNPIIKTKVFPTGFTTQNFILAVAGSN